MGKLTDTTLRAAKGTGKIQKLSDGGGLYLFISANGGKAWRVKYRFEGKEKTLSLGQYPQVTLIAARKFLAEAKEQLAHGKVEVNYIDETAWRRFGHTGSGLYWLWIMISRKVAYFFHFLLVKSVPRSYANIKRVCKTPLGSCVMEFSESSKKLLKVFLDRFASTYLGL